MTDTVFDEVSAAPRQESAGRKLGRARESQGMDIVEVARALRLSVKQVEAIEADDHESLPGRTFVRGFVRNYARLVNLDPDLIVEEYLPLQPETEAQNIQAPSQQIRFSEHPGKPWLKWLAGVAVAVILASWGILVWIGPEIGRTVATQKTLPPTSSEMMPVQAVTQPPAVPAPDVSISSPGASGRSETPAPPAATPPPSVPAGAPLAQVTMSFSGTSWVEALDKNGKKIHSQNNLAGTRQVLEGEPPISLVIGSAPNVRLFYKGQPVDLFAHTKADVARLTLD